MCEVCLPLYPTPEDGVLEGETKHLMNSILAILRVLLNLTHDHGKDQIKSITVCLRELHFV